MLNTVNEFLVGSGGNGVVIMNPPGAPISKEQAIRLAVYLIVLSGATDDEVNAMRAAVGAVKPPPPDKKRRKPR